MNLFDTPNSSEASSMGFIPIQIQKGIASYSSTGELPDTPFWNRQAARHAANPQRFELTHPVIGGLFTKPDVIGEMPETAYWNNLRFRFDLNAARFKHYHPFLGSIMQRDYDVRHEIIPIPPSECLPGHCEPPVTPCVPEPMAFVPMSVGLVIVFIVQRLWFR